MANKHGLKGSVVKAQAKARRLSKNEKKTVFRVHIGSENGQTRSNQSYKKGNTISRTNKIGQRKNSQQKISNLSLIWEFLMREDFLKKEKRKIFTQSLWSIRKDWIFMVCREENSRAIFQRQKTKDKVQKTKWRKFFKSLKMTDFQHRVYSALKLIPRGKVTTYKLLGEYIGCKSAQAIGQALTRNPDAPEVPCHRVIKTDRSIGGYAFGVEEKMHILASEGICFHVMKEKYILVDQDKIWDFTA